MSIVINDRSPRVHYIATSGQRTFVVPFEWISNSDLKVYVNENLMTYSAVPPANASQYSALGEGVTNGGSITFGTPGRVVSDQVIIFRDMPIQRTADLPVTGVFPVESLNENLDAETAMIQQTEVNVEKRTIRLHEADFTLELNKLPSVSGRMGRVLGFDFNGQPVLVKPSELLNLGGTGDTDPGASFLGLIWTGDDPPPAPWMDGQLWWDSDAGHLMLWYDDGTSQQWIQVNVASGTFAMGPISAPTPAILDVFTLTAVNGEFTMPPNARLFRLRGCGGGGGGGGVHSTLNTLGAGAGAGFGGFGETDWFDATGVSGATYQIGQGGVGGFGVTGNAGGASTWNDGVRSLTWFGGNPGTGSPGIAIDHVRPPGIPGNLSAGFQIMGGSSGETGIANQNTLVGGFGGSNPLGQGGAATYGTSSQANGGTASIGYGGGGGGGVRPKMTTGDCHGGNGRQGVIYVEVLF